MNRTDIQPLLSHFKDQVRQLYRERLAGLYLFGSYARGDADERSDVDILVVLHDEHISPFNEIDAMGDLAFDLELRFEKPISIVPATRRQFESLSSPLYLNVQREGQFFL